MVAIGFYTCGVVFVLLPRVSVLRLKERKGRRGDRYNASKQALAVLLQVMKGAACD